MERLGKVPVSDVLPYVLFVENDRHGQKPELHKREYLGALVNMTSDRLRTFSTSGLRCIRCGIEGSFFAVERHTSNISYHLNLYAVDGDGREVLMTKDHIRARADGGRNALNNYQTMCNPCNEHKASKKHPWGKKK